MQWWVREINKLPLNHAEVLKLRKRIKQACKNIRKRGMPSIDEKRFLKKAQWVWITKISHACVWEYYLEHHDVFAFKTCKEHVHELLENYADLTFYHVDEAPDKYVGEIQEKIHRRQHRDEMNSGHMFVSVAQTFLRGKNRK